MFLSTGAGPEGAAAFRKNRAGSWSVRAEVTTLTVLTACRRAAAWSILEILRGSDNLYSVPDVSSS